MLSKADRRTRHLTAAHHFEAAGEDELAGLVAAHYVEALAATPAGPDADALAARARDALGQAAERATDLGSPMQALGFAEQALAITPTGHERADLLGQAADAARDALRREDTLAYLREAVQVLGALDNVDEEVATMGVLASALGDQNQLDELRTLVERMHERLGEGGDDLARAELHHAVAIVRYFDGDYEACLASIELALPGFEGTRARDRFRKTIGEKTAVLGMVGRVREARLLIRGRLALATEENDLREMSAALGSAALWNPEIVEAVDGFMEAAAVARRGGYGESEMGALANGLEAAVEAGAWEVADRIIEDLRGRSDVPQAVLDTLALGAALLAAYRGDAAGAAGALARVSSETLSSPDPQIRAWVRRARAVLLLMGGDVDEACREARGAIEEDPSGLNVPLAVWTAGRAALWLCDPTEARAVVDAARDPEGGWAAASKRSYEAGIAALEGRAREAAATYEVLLRGRLAAGDRFAHAQVVTDMVAVLPPEHIPEEAVEAARSYLQEIGAVPLLARLTRSDVPAASER